jgi:hypothetical protein
MKIDRVCIICEKELECCGLDEDDFSNPPNNATYWTTSGNYGSTVFDPCGTGEQLECYICDECLKKKAKFVYEYRIVRKNELEYKDIKKFGE